MKIPYYTSRPPFRWVIYGLLLLAFPRHAGAVEFAVPGPVGSTPPNVQLSNGAYLNTGSTVLSYFTYSSPDDNPTPGQIVFNFPDTSRPSQLVQSFNAAFDFLQDADAGNPANELIDASFWFTPFASGNPIFSGGLNVRYQVQLTDDNFEATFIVSWKGQELGRLARIPVVSDLGPPPGPVWFSHCSVSYSAGNGLSVSVSTADGSQTLSVINGATISWNPQLDWRFAFTAVPSGTSGGSFIDVVVQNVAISGQTAPYFTSTPGDRTSFQDFADQFDFDLDTLEGHPENVQVTAQSSNPAVFTSSNLTITALSPTRRRVILNPLRGGHGDTTVTLSLDPGGGGPVTTTNYHHTVVANVPPTISQLTNLTLPRNITRVVPFSIGSAHWPLSQVNVSIASFTQGLLTENSIFVQPVDANRVNWQLVLTPAMVSEGNGDVLVRVTDGSGDSTDSHLSLTTDLANEPPTVLGAGSALALNRDPDQGQSAVETGASDLALNSTATVEAWVRPRQFTDPKITFVTFVGGRGQGQAFILALQNDGSPSFASIVNDVYPPNAKYKVNLNEWHHLAAVLNGTSVQFYVDGQLSSSGNVPNAPSIISDGLMIGNEPSLGGNRRLIGDIDEVRVWNVARSATDLAANMRRRVAFDSPGLLRYYRFDEGFLHFDGGNPALPAVGSPLGGSITDSSVHQARAVLTGYPSFVPGIPMESTIDVEQNATNTIGLATVVEGENAWGTAGVAREIFFGPNSPNLSMGLESSPGWSFRPDVQFANGVGLEVPPGGPIIYGERIRGYLLPPETGTYTLSIASANEGQLWLSPSEDSGSISMVASSPASGISFRQFNLNPSQSTQVQFAAGKRYYFEVRHQAGDGSAGAPHLSVSWVLPQGSVETPIPAHRIQPVGLPGPASLSVQLLAPPINGVTSVSNGSLVYGPLPNFFGPDALTFQANAVGTVYPAPPSVPSRIILNVLNRNPSPVAGTGGALLLDGVSGALASGSTLSLGSDSFTVELWARRTRNTLGSDEVLWSHGSRTAAIASLGWFNNTGKLGFRAEVAGGTPQDFPSQPYLDTAWHHWAVAFTATNQQVEVFRDGVSQGTAVMSPNFATDALFYVGSFVGDSAYFPGAVDEVRVWARLRSHDELLATMNTTLVGNENGLVLYYRLNEGNGLTAFDSSALKPGNVHYDGALTNLITWINGVTNFSTVIVPRNSPGQSLFLPGFAVSNAPVTYQLTQQPQNGALNPDPQNPGRFTFVPNANYFGSDSFAYTVSAGGLTSVPSVVNVLVKFLPIPPQISIIRDQAFEEEDPALVLPFTLADVDDPSGNSLVVSATSGNATLLPLTNIVFSGTGNARRVTLDPVNGEIGVSSVTITVQNINHLTASTTFLVRVSSRLAYKVISVGEATGTAYSFATAVNASGQVSGYFADDATATNARPFRYNGYGSAILINSTETLGGAAGFALSLNASGLLVGVAENTQGQPNAFQVDPAQDSVPTSLGTLPGGTISAATAINDNGLVVGYGQAGDGSFHAITAGTTPLTALVLTNGLTNMWALAVNKAGVIAGYGVDANGATNGFVTALGQTRNLGRPPGASHAILTTINSDGIMAGHATFPTGAPLRPVMHDGVQWTVFDDPLGGGSAEVWSINRFRQLVGRGLTTNGLWHAYIRSDNHFRDLNDLHSADSDWVVTDARSINDKGQIAASGQQNGGLTQALLLFPASEIGRRVYRPPGTLAKLPDIQILNGSGTDQAGNSFFWSAGESKLFAIRPVVASLGWHTGSYVVTTNETEFGDTVIRQTFTNEVLLETLTFNIWPHDPEIHVVGTPVQTQPNQGSFQYSFLQLSYTTAGGGAVDNSTKIFTSLSPGYSVLHYLQNNGLPPNAETQPNHFTVARSIMWNDPNFVVTNVPWPVGTAITNALHNDYAGLNGYVLSTNAYFDGVGPNVAYSRTNRTGPILPVNANDRGEEFVVVWYAFDSIGTSWSSYPYSYAVRWPTNAPAIVIASQLGSGPLPANQYLNPQVYDQPDATRPGFNPNEEHALVAPGAEGPVVYALRDDLNARINPKASDPFVLLKYQDPTTQEWRIQVFAVVAEQWPYFFNYNGTAGEEIAPPLPLSLLPLAGSSNRIVSGPAWQDYNGIMYARAAGANGGGAEVVLEFFYPLQPGFFYDLNRNGKPERTVGDVVPWLDRHPPGTPGVPINVSYGITWPTDVPVLNTAQTLTTATGGLPDVSDMASAQVIFDTLDPQGTNALFASARLFDPLSPRFFDLGEKFKFPTDVARSTDPATGNEIFPDLPYYLRVRLFHDPRNHRLGFRGFNYSPPDGGPGTLLVNVMSLNERGIIEALDSSGDQAFRNAVDTLYRITRNPNGISLTGDGNRSDALLVGLTTQVVTNGTTVTTNIVRENLGGGPKGLTTGQPLPDAGMPRPYGVRLDATQHGRLAVGTNYYASITNNFTVEFWVKPEASQRDTDENNEGIVGINRNDQYVVYPIEGGMTYGANHAGVGIAVGTDRISVYEHSDNLLCTPLVYPVALSGWHHVAVVYENSTPSLYVDGAKVRTGLTSPRAVHPSAELASVDAPWGDYGGFVGSVTDLRVWNVARQPDDIILNFGAVLTGTETNLAGLWRFDESTGATVHDRSSAAHNGTLSGAYTWTPGTGLAPRYVVVAENNDPSLPGLPVGLHVIQIGNQLTRGNLVLIQPDNVLDERLTIRHSADFAGQPTSFFFQWFYQVDDGNVDPTLMPTTTNGVVIAPGKWIPYPVTPPDGTGANDITLGAGQLSGLITLSDTYFIVRYGYTGKNGQTNWSDWAGDPSATIAPRAMFVPGWIKRVLAGINLFAQRSSDFLDNSVNTLVSALGQSGPRYEGDVALNPDKLDQFGLIEVYATILNRARNLSINGTPPVDFAPANSALLLAAGNIADLYVLHANEAFAEAEDPTIGLTTDSPGVGNLASSLFAFENQVDSLLEQELVLLRGRDDHSEGVGAAPVYNRFYWNFTHGDGELAYVSKFGIPDQNSDGFINALDAQILYPQGHGDAWGHYLTALTTYYDLLRNPNYTWIPRTQNTIVAGVPVQVNYEDERNFANAAASKARTGAEIVARTFRLNFTEDIVTRVLNPPDTDPLRAWGISDWARRAAMGAYFDWITGNAILPPVDPDPTHTGIQKIDRTTVPQLAQVVAESQTIVNTIAQFDGGLDPLGFASGIVPFDIDPELLDTGFSRSTHFEQIYNRALQALQNAEVTFNRATELSSQLVNQQNSVSDYSVAVFNQELSYRNQLIAIFGYPYGGDLGPGGAFPSDYQGPDLTHWMYVDTLDVTPANNPRGEGFTDLYTTIHGIAVNWGAQFSSDIPDSVNPATNRFIEVDYPISAANYAFQAPSEWGNRRAEGTLQTDLRQLVLAQAQLRQAATAYDNLVKDLEDQADLLNLRYGLRRDLIDLLNAKENTVISLNAFILAAKTTKVVADGITITYEEAATALARAVPDVLGLATDALAAVDAAVYIATAFTKEIPEKISQAAEVLDNGLELSKEIAEVDIDRQAQIKQQDYELTERVKELQAMVLQEAPLRLDLFNANQAIIQAARNVETHLATGQQVLEQRTVFRQQTAGTISADRYRDLALRTFRNDALQKYDTQFELTARYVQMAASAYNYEVNGADGGDATSYIADIVKERNLGELNNGDPVVGRVGLATILGRLKQNFDVLKGQLGLNNVQQSQKRFSLRTEALRILPAGTNSADANWRAVLQQAIVTNLWAVPEFRRYCRPFAPESAGAQPGIVLRFSSTITPGQNFFGKQLGPLDSIYDPSQYSTRIRSVGVWFSNYDSNKLTATPYVYLIPTGADLLRSPKDATLAFRSWQVVDQSIPVPFPIASGDLDNPNWIPGMNAQDGNFVDIRHHSAFEAFRDGTFDASQFTTSTRLVGRSVANTQWVLIVPGAYLLWDPVAGLNDFINTISDIKLYFQTYSASGN